jgi:sugar/nucleoside kinase (ribokinase family)
MRFDVFGMCNALFDIQATVADRTLDDLGVRKGGMYLIDDRQRERVVAHISGSIVNTAAGGSGANTMSGLAMLGGSACYTSRVGEDDFGVRYREALASTGVQPNLGVGKGATGVSIILVTPDAQRTMLTYLGQSRELQPGDVAAGDIADSSCVYITGYLWDTDGQKAAVLYAMKEARRAGAKVAFSLADMFCVERNRDDFADLLRKCVNIVFANNDEARALTGAPTAAEAARALSAWCEVVAVTDGSRGSVVCKGTASVAIPVATVDVVDTTGAGDMYAAGLLYGLSRSMSIESAGSIASYCAGQVVSRMGPRLSGVDAGEIARLTSAR